MDFESFIDEFADALDTLIEQKEDGGSVTKTTKAHVEEEQAFIILADDPKPVIERLGEFKKLGTYKVGTGELLHIVDTFYDTTDSDIRLGKKSLRVREVNGIPHVTLKGKNQAKDGGSKRSEFEVEWPWQGKGMPHPHDVADLFCLEQIQRRETERIARPIIRWDDLVIAELAIDKVSYDFGKGSKARLYEVEIELKSSKAPSLKSLTTSLRNKFDKLLWPWDASKFATGQILEQALKVQLDDDGFVTCQSFNGLINLRV